MARRLPAARPRSRCRWPSPSSLATALLAAALSLAAEGTYATPFSVAAASAALLGLAALEATGLVAVRRLAFLVALLFLLVRPL